MINNYAEISQYKKFREENPQYDHIPDAILLKAVHQVKYPQLPFDVFKKSFDDVYGEKPTVGKDIVRGFMSGIGETIAGVGSIIDYLGGRTEPNFITRFGEETYLKNAPLLDIEGSIRDNPDKTIGNIHWWLYNISNLLPFTLSVVIPTTTAAGIASTAAKAAGMSSRAIKMIQIGSGALSGGLYESLMEAGNVYNQSIQEGVSLTEARNRANSTLGKNLVLNVAINAIQIGKILHNSKVPITPKELKVTAKKLLSDLGVASVTDMAQEWTQQIISNTALGNEPFEGGWESAILGAVGGFFYGGGLEVLNNVGSARRNEILDAMQKAHEESQKGETNEPPSPSPPTSTQPLVEPPQKVELGIGETTTEGKETGKITEMSGKSSISERAKEFGKTVSEIKDPALLNGVIKEMEDILSNNGKDRELVELMRAMRKTYKDDKVYARWLATSYGDLLSGYIKKQKTRKKAGELKPNKIVDDIAETVDEQLKEKTTSKPKEELIPEKKEQGVIPPQNIEEFNKKRELIESNPDLNEEQKRQALKVLEDSRGLFLMDKLESAFGGEHKELIRAQINLLANALDMTPQEFVSKTISDVIIGGKYEEDKGVVEFQNSLKDIRDIIGSKSVSEFLSALYNLQNIYEIHGDTQNLSLLKAFISKWESLISSKDTEEFESGKKLLMQELEHIINETNKFISGIPENEEVDYPVTQIKSVMDNLLDATNKLFFNDVKLFEPYYQSEKSIQNGIINGATKIAKDGRAIINLFDNANFSTFTHELFHAVDLAGLLPEESIHYMEEYVRKPYREWGKNEREKLARAWETYWMEGIAPQPQLKKVFDKIKKVMLKIYDGLKSLIGEEIPSDLRRAFDIMIDKETRLEANAEIKISRERKEILGGNKEIKIKAGRIVGSLDDVSAEDVTKKQEALRNIGYQSETIENPDGTFTIMYYLTKNPKVERAISLQRREIESGDLGVRETKELGSYYGYTKAERDQFIDLWRAKVKAIKEKERYYEGETYASAYRNPKTGKVEVGKNIWRIKSRDGNKITLELVGGKLFNITGGTNIEFTATEEELRRMGYVREKVKKPGLPRGSTIAKATEQRKKIVDSWYPDEESSVDDVDNYISKEVMNEFKEAQEKVTPQQTIQSSLTEEDEVLPEGFNIKTPGFPSDYETYLSDKLREKEILEVAKDTREKGDTELADKLEHLVAELRKGNKEAKSIIESDPDTDLPSGTLEKIPPEIRLQHYRDLGLTEEEGNVLSDDELEEMLMNKYGTFFQMVTPGMTKDQINQSEKEGKEISEKIGIESIKEMFPPGTLMETIKRSRDQVFLFLGMKQSLARYQPRLFGKLFYTVNDLIRLADEKINYLLSPSYRDVTHASHSSKSKIAQALIEGTLYKERIAEDSNDIVERPKKVWLGWKPLKEYADTHTAEEVVKERQRRKAERQKYKENMAKWIEAKTRRKSGIVWTSDQLRTKFGMNDKEIKMYYTVRNTIDGAVVLMKNAAIAYGMSAEEAEKVFSSVGYCPLDRGTGKWALFFPDSDSETGYNYTRFKSYKDAVNARKRLVESGVIKDDDPRTLVHRASESVNYQPNLLSLDAMIDYIESAGIPANKISDYPEIERLMKEVKKRTYTTQRLIRRGNASLIVDADNLFEVIDTFVTRAARRYAKSLANPYIESEVRAVPKSSIWAKFAREYVHTAFSIASNPAAEARWNKIRKFGFLWFLALNVKNGLENLTQPALTTIPFLLEAKWGLGVGEVTKAVKQAVQASLAYTFDKEIPKSILKKYPGLPAAIEEWKSKAVTSPTLAEQLAGIRGGMEEFTHTLGYLQFTTEKQDRSFSAIIGYTLAQRVLQNAKGNPKLALELSEMIGISEELMQTIAVRVPYEKRSAVFDSIIKERQQKIVKGEFNDPVDLQIFATKFGSVTADTTQFVFGRHTFPNYITSAGWLTSPLKSAFLFKGFINNYIGFFLTGLQKGRFRPAQMIAMLAPLLILYGIKGLPFLDDLKEALYESGITDVNTKLRRIINDPTISDLVLKGVPSILWDSIAFDVSRHGGAGSILPEGMASAIGKTVTLQPTASDYGKMLTDIFGGAPLGGVTEMADGIRNIWEGQYSIGAQKLMPIFLRNVWKAGRQSIRGVVTEGGNLRVPKGKLGGSIGMIRTALGFQPARVSKAIDFERAIKFLQASRKSRTSLFNEKIAEALRTNDMDLLNDTMLDIISYNSKVRPGYRYDINAQMPTIRRRVSMGRIPEFEVYGSPRSLAPEYLEIQRLYK